MTTRKELISKCYLDFLNEITEPDIKSLFPDLTDFDVCDIVMFLEYFQDLDSVRETVLSLLILYGKSELEDKLDCVLPTIEKFLKHYFQIKKI